MDGSHQVSQYEPESPMKSVHISLNTESMPQHKFAKTARSIKAQEL